MQDSGKQVDSSETPDHRDHPRPRVVLVLIFCSFILTAVLTYLISPGGSSALPLVFGEALLIIPTLLYLKLKQYEFRRVFRLHAVSFNVLAASVLLGLSLPILGDELDRLISRFIEMPPEFEQLLLELFKVNSVWDWIALVFGIVLLAAIVEELLFRGLLQKALETRVDSAYAILFSSFAFAMVHPSVWFVQALVLGCAFGYVVWRSQSVVPGVILHSLNNAISLIFTNFAIDEAGWYQWNGHVHPTLLAISACVIFYSFKWFHHGIKGEQNA